MAIHIHTVSVPDFGNNFKATDRIFAALVPISYGIGGGADAAVTVAVAFTGGEMPLGYTVLVGNVAADVTTAVTVPLTTGFSIAVRPRRIADTLAAGTLTAFIVA